MKVKLTSLEYEYIQSNFFIDKIDLIKSIKSEKFDNKVILNLPDEIAEEIREWACEKLPIVGFNEDYELNSEGKILDNFIDKFYIN